MSATYSYVFPLDFFLCGLASVYFVAFSSILHQIPGLYGENGLEPVDIYLYHWKERHQLLESSFLEKYLQKPTFLWLVDTFENPILSPSFLLEIICMIGMVISILSLLQKRWRHQIWSFGIMWLCYLSITHVGQTFMQFQWDSFLLEVGFLSIWLTCTENKPSASIVWSLRYLFLKFMFMSGAVKIQARCPTWLGLTALEYHYATQPLPLPLSWYAHQLPPIIHRFSVGMTLLIEGPLTFFIMVPLQVCRKFEAFIQVFLQILIMLTGNYNFFNILTALMAISLIDIQVNNPPSSSTICFPRKWWYEKILSIEKWWYKLQTCSKCKKIQVFFLLMFFLYSFTHVLEFVIEDTKQKKTKKNKWLPISIRFVPTVEETQAWIALVLPRMIIGSFCVIFVSGLWQMLIVFISHRNGCTVKQILYLIWTLCISVHVFVASTMTFSTLDHSFQEKLLFSSNIFKNAYVLTEKFHVVHPYGLFRRMTGIGKLKNEGEMILARPEIILEKTFDQGQTWKEFSFHYKPGDLFTSPRRAMPFQPRLDWQMWFAALEEDYQKAPWLVHLIDKLLENTKEVKALLDLSKQQQQQEEEESSPQAIRAVLYYYDYTRWNTSWSFQIPNAFFLNETNSKQWWHRFHPKEYLPPLEKNNPSVKAFLKQFGWTTRTSKTTKTLTCWQEWWCFLIEKLIQWKEIGAISMALSIWMLEDCYWRVVVVVKKKKLKKF